jgi:hypothetical protein
MRSQGTEIEIYFRDLSLDLQHAVLDAVNKGGSVDIMFDQLSDEKQAEILDVSGYTDPSLANWDTMPITMVEFDHPKQGDPPIRRASDMNWDTFPLAHVEYDSELEEDVFDVEENPRRLTALRALRAIVARIDGVWDDKDLMVFGPLSTNTLDDVYEIARSAIRGK